jgi:hypothetical protein
MALTTVVVLLMVVTGTGASGVFAFAMCSECSPFRAEEFDPPAPDAPATPAPHPWEEPKDGGQK